MRTIALPGGIRQAMRWMAAVQDNGMFDDQAWRQESRQAMGRLIMGHMQAKVGAHLQQCQRDGVADRRNGSYSRHWLTELGDLELEVPRTRRFNPVGMLQAYARRAPQVERMILACFVLGLSTRKVAEALLPILGEPISPGTVSTVAKTLDGAVQAWHRRKLCDGYRVLMFDGVVVARKTGAGALRRPVLVVLGIRPDGKKEVIDFRQAPGESQAAWEAFLNDLHRRGLTGEKAELVVSDGGKGLLAALPLVYPHLPVQRCWAHKSRNVLDSCRKADRPAVKRDLHRVMYAPTLPAARSAAARFATCWSALYPKAVACLRADLEALLEHYRLPADWRKACRTTNAIERRFREVKRRTRPMGVMADRTSVERILYAVFARENRNQGITTLFPLTHNS